MSIRMANLKSTEALIVAAICTAFLTSACDRAPATPKPVKPPATKADQDARNKNAIAELIRSGQKDSSANSGALPPGHPPIAGATSQPQMSGAAGTNGLPPGHPPLPASGAMSGPGPVTPAANLKLTAPESWKPQTPTSMMRKAQYLLPKADGDTQDGELIVFYFGPGEGGTVAANLDRWKGMFVGTDGGALPESATTVEEFTANGMKVTLLNVTGRYVASDMMTGTKKDPSSTDFIMTAAVVDTPSGPWYVKALGPAPTMKQHLQEIRAMLESARHP